MVWNKIIQDGAKFDNFDSSGDPRFATLDLKLHCALTQCIREGNKTLAAKLASSEDTAMNGGKILKGRQLGWLIHDWFRLNPDLKPLYGLQEIADIQWFGDDKIFEFLDLWKQVVGNNTITMSENQLAEILVGKMKGKTKVLAEDVAYWLRLPAGNEQRTHEYLLNAMQAHLDRTQMEKNNSTRRVLVQGGKIPGLGAPAPTGKRPCYFHNHGGCKNTEDKCRYAHVLVPDDQKAKMTKPTRSPSPEGRGKGRGKGGGKGDGKSSGTGGDSSAGALRYCHWHLKGKCTRGDDCHFPHIDKAEVDRLNKVRAKAKAKAKAEPNPQKFLAPNVAKESNDGWRSAAAE